MKILMVTAEAPDRILGGLGVYTANVYKAFKELGHEVTLLHLDEDNQPGVMADEYIPYKTDIRHSNPEVSMMVRAMHAQETLKDYDADIIHCNEWWTAIPFWFRPNMVFYSHASRPGLIDNMKLYNTFHLWGEYHSVLMSKRYMCGSRYISQHLGYAYKKPPMIIPLGVDFDAFSGKKIETPKPVVSFFGRHYDKSKGFNSFISMAEKYKDHFEFRAYSPVDISEEGSFRKMGFVKGEDLKKAFQETDVVFMPSHHESYGLVGLEGLASNCFLVCRPGLGMDEYATDKNSLRTTNFVEAFEWLKENMESVQNKAKHNVYRNSVKPHTWDVVAQKHIKVFQEVINERKRK